MKTVEIATNNLLGTVWTLTFIRENDSSIKILSYGSDQSIGYDFEKHTIKCRMVEDDQRNILGVKFIDRKSGEEETLMVLNRKYVFDYKLK